MKDNYLLLIIITFASLHHQLQKSEYCTFFEFHILAIKKKFEPDPAIILNSKFGLHEHFCLDLQRHCQFPLQALENPGMQKAAV